MEMLAEIAIQESRDVQGVPGTAIHRGFRHPEFEIGRQLETDLSATKVRLRV